MGSPDDRYAGFPRRFFRRYDESPDTDFYAPPRLVTHIDERAIAAVGDLYAELGVDGSAPRPTRVLDLMSSWVSHFKVPPAELAVLGLNAHELASNPAARLRVVHDLNVDPRLPFRAGVFDAVVCCVSVDYLIHPIEVVADVARVLVPGGAVCFTFSNRCFMTKAIAGWLSTPEDQHPIIVAEYIRRAGGFDAPTSEQRTPPGPGDALWAVWARRSAGPFR